MRKVIVNEFMSLDGVAQAPGGAEEDTSGSFAHGGWHMRYMEDEFAQRWVLESIVAAGGFLLGRRTYEIFAAYWPNAPEGEQVIAEPLNTKAEVRGLDDAHQAARLAELGLGRGRRRGGGGGAEARGRRRPACDRQHGVGADAD